MTSTSTEDHPRGGHDSDVPRHGVTRRGALAGIGAAIALAGCLGGTGAGATSTPTATPAGPTQPGATETTGTPSALDTSPGTADLEVQPRLGPPIGDAPGVIVAFEDPSCTTCRRFEERSFPTLRRDVIDAGDATFVFRGFPVIYPWGEPASHALEATYARDEAAFLDLKAHYYAAQGRFNSSNVLDRTAAFLRDETDLDADAIVTDVREERFADAVNRDLDAGRAAGFSATPSFLLFRDGALVTSLVGAKSPEVFTTALRL